MRTRLKQSTRWSTHAHKTTHLLRVFATPNITPTQLPPKSPSHSLQWCNGVQHWPVVGVVVLRWFACVISLCAVWSTLIINLEVREKHPPAHEAPFANRRPVRTSGPTEENVNFFICLIYFNEERLPSHRSLEFLLCLLCDQGGPWSRPKLWTFPP